MAERTEWPSEETVDRLRSSGVVPVSKFAVASFAAILVIVAAASLGGAWAELEKLTIAGLQSAEGERALFVFVKAKGLSLFVVPAAAVILGTFMLGLFQSRFLFRPAAVAFDFSKLAPSGRQERLCRRLVFFLAPMLALLIIGVSVLIFRLTLPQFLGLLTQRQEQVPGAVWSILSHFLPFFLFALLAGCFSAWLLGRFFFMLNNRISKEEAAREGRDDLVPEI